MACQLRAMDEYNSSSESSESESSGSEEDIQCAKKRKAVPYLFVQSFSSTEAAIEEVSREWTVRTTKDTHDGRKKFYDCKASKACPMKLYLLFQNDKQSVHLHQTQGEHANHEKNCGIPKDTKAAIQDLFAVGVTKPNAILRSLRDKGLPEPHTRQLRNYLAQLRLKKNG